MKKIIGAVVCITIFASCSMPAMDRMAASALNSHNPSYASTETKKEFVQRLETRWDHAKKLRAANHPDPYKSVEKTLDAGWKHTWCQKNPGTCFAIIAGTIIAGTYIVYRIARSAVLG